MKGEQLLKYESVQKWLNSLETSAKKRGKKGLSKNGRNIRLGRMWEFTVQGKFSPDELLKEAQQDIYKTGKRLDDYFEARKKQSSHNTALTALSFIRGFYSHNGITFPRDITLPKKLEAKVASVDNEKVSFYDFDEETEKIIFKNGTLQHFIGNLNFRDRTIALCLLSTGADATDLLNLKVSFVKDLKGELCKKTRFFWHGTRAKTREPFRTFFSKEATHHLKTYFEQERKDASDDEPLFVQPPRTYTRQNPISKEEETITETVKYNRTALSVNFRVAAEKMGYTTKGEHSPFRPKRFRKLFRTACGIAEIDPGYTKAMMGHASDVSAGYLEKDPALFKKVYVRVEPFLTVFGESDKQLQKEHNELRDDFTDYAQKVLRLEETVHNLTGLVNEQQGQLKSAIKYIATLKEELSDRDRAEAEEDFRQTVEEVNKTQSSRKRKVKE